MFSLAKKFKWHRNKPSNVRNLIHCVLVQPQIPHNTGSIGRTCLGFGARLHIVGPTGFKLDDASVRRAGLDYWKHVDLRVYEDWQSFENQSYHDLKKNAYLFSKFGDTSLLDVNFVSNDKNEQCDDVTLFFGSETKGLHKLIPEEVIKRHQVVYMPMFNPGHRQFDTPSFNLATSVSIGLWEVYRQLSKNK